MEQKIQLITMFETSAPYGRTTTYLFSLFFPRVSKLNILICFRKHASRWFFPSQSVIFSKQWCLKQAQYSCTAERTVAQTWHRALYLIWQLSIAHLLPAGGFLGWAAPFHTVSCSVQFPEQKSTGQYQIVSLISNYLSSLLVMDF